MQAHRRETFKLSPGPRLIDQVRDSVGLYMKTPTHAGVFCVDEKSQIQALDRTQPPLPMRPGQTGRRTHDYRRHGTTTLFAAPNVKTSTVITQFHRRHRAVEFRQFLDAVDAAVPPDPNVHLILNNYGPHETALIRKWLAKRPRFHVHFTPPYGSWLHLWSGGLRSSPTNNCAGARTATSSYFTLRSANSLLSITRILTPLFGPKAPMRFSPASRASLNGRTTFRSRHLLRGWRGDSGHAGARVADALPASSPCPEAAPSTRAYVFSGGYQYRFRVPSERV